MPTSMTTPIPIPRPVQYPILPWEITDAIIDHLHSDVRALGVCSTVCAEWLIRSRYHIFSTVQLWPWRAQRFFDLAGSEKCTFVNQIRCIKVDDSKTKAAAADGRAGGTGMDERDGRTPFFEAMAYSSFPCFARVRTLAVHNVDWTKLSLRQQCTLRTRLSQFHQLDRLELHGVIFHDMREVARVVDAFPALYHLTANVTFMKFLEHTIASAMANPLSNKLRSLEVGTEEGVPVLLSSIAFAAGREPIRELKLRNVRSDHLQYIQNALRKAENKLRHLSLGFELESGAKVSKEDIVRALDFSHLSHLQTLRLEGLNFFKTPCMEERLSGILESIESSFLESIHLRVRMDVEDSVAKMQKFNWCRIERALLALHFFGMKFVVVVVDIPSRSTVTEEEVGGWITGGMSDLYSRGALRVSVVREGRAGEVESSSGQSNVLLAPGPGTVLTIRITVASKA
ncbi:hypothetical protein CVT25_007286 [Psilocybe cyanescens]|uniref:F-box domain-containing protein n=1 Tax=Psilocybe cyanescens TaxID=93625 RepID=A0A409XPE3_PSICY|nr:hypothetical protein CVT25_007286 [Psilocybe cyanescens]